MEKYLILENGKVFQGVSFGYDGEAIGELVFNTGMTGYLETLTDPSYYGQIVTQTFPLIGNYGVIPSDFESQQVFVKAYIVREWCQVPSNFRSEGDLDIFLRQQKVPGICGIDTRELTRIVREHGVMNAKVSNKPQLTPEEMAELKAYRIAGSVEATTVQEPVVYQPEGEPQYEVVLWDFGAKHNIERELLRRGCKVTVVPAHWTAEQIMGLVPDGVMLSNGPGDPADNKQVVAEIRKLFTYRVPIFGICLGHQMLALAAGAQTTKLLYGHRGANQPVLDKKSGRVYVTSQNHGYAVVSETLPDTAEESFSNANDGSCEGVDYKDMPVFSVQFHPEACGGPLDTDWLFDRFIDLMRGGK